MAGLPPRAAVARQRRRRDRRRGAVGAGRRRRRWPPRRSAAALRRARYRAGPRGGALRGTVGTGRPLRAPTRCRAPTSRGTSPGAGGSNGGRHGAVGAGVAGSLLACRPPRSATALDVDLLGAVHGARAALPAHARAGRGVLVVVASLHGQAARPVRRAAGHGRGRWLRVLRRCVAARSCGSAGRAASPVTHGAGPRAGPGVGSAVRCGAAPRAGGVDRRGAAAASAAGEGGGRGARPRPSSTGTPLVPARRAERLAGPAAAHPTGATRRADTGDLGQPDRQRLIRSAVATASRPVLRSGHQHRRRSPCPAPRRPHRRRPHRRRRQPAPETSRPREVRCAGREGARLGGRRPGGPAQAQGPGDGPPRARRPVPPPAIASRWSRQPRRERAGRRRRQRNGERDGRCRRLRRAARRPGRGAHPDPGQGLVAGHPPGVQGVLGRQRRDPRRRRRLRGFPRRLPGADRRDQPLRAGRRPRDDRPAGRGRASRRCRRPPSRCSATRSSR